MDWYPWGSEALARAKRENKPIFLSIGYSACHWCHVMAHESFEDPATAEVMNRHFVAIKVDREERPDLDEIYMQAVILMTGSGGWPMSVWLTPDLKPFYGGTYFPPDGRYGRPAFRTVLEGLAKAYREKPDEVAESSEQLVAAIRQQTGLAEGLGGALTRDPIPATVASLTRTFDPEFGGFGGAPKFPPSMDLVLLLREHRRTGDPALLAMVETTLDRMARGGMYDQLGGGFHRYATDEKWLIPHFEKMLYDNALLARTYAFAWQVTGKPAYARIARETLDYVLREMTSPEGGFYAAQDADSEGEEGKFFAWAPAEILSVLGEADGKAFCQAYDVTASGNFEHGKSALWLPKPLTAAEEARFAPLRARLLAAREERVKPGLDAKILADWNGLMIRGLAEVGFILDEPRYLDAARKAADFCLAKMRKAGRLLHTYGRSEAKFPAYLDDHAFLLAACLALTQTTGEGRWLVEAKGLADLMAAHFLDASEGGFFFTADDHEALIARTRHPGDNALPSGNSVAAMALLRLSALTGEARWREMAEGTLRAFSGLTAQHPRGFAEMLCALDLATAEPLEIVVTGTQSTRRPLLAELRRHFLPDAVLLPFDPGAKTAEGMAKAVPLLVGKALVAGRPAAYVCSRGACQRPVTEADELAALLDMGPRSVGGC